MAVAPITDTSSRRVGGRRYCQSPCVLHYLSLESGGFITGDLRGKTSTFLGPIFLPRGEDIRRDLSTCAAGDPPTTVCVSVAGGVAVSWPAVVCLVEQPLPPRSAGRGHLRVFIGATSASTSL